MMWMGDPVETRNMITRIQRQGGRRYGKRKTHSKRKTHRKQKTHRSRRKTRHSRR